MTKITRTQNVIAKNLTRVSKKGNTRYQFALDWIEINKTQSSEVLRYYSPVVFLHNQLLLFFQSAILSYFLFIYNTVAATYGPAWRDVLFPSSTLSSVLLKSTNQVLTSLVLYFSIPFIHGNEINRTRIKHNTRWCIFRTTIDSCSHLHFITIGCIVW